MHIASIDTTRPDGWSTRRLGSNGANRTSLPPSASARRAAQGGVVPGRRQTGIEGGRPTVEGPPGLGGPVLADLVHRLHTPNLVGFRAPVVRNDRVLGPRPVEGDRFALAREQVHHRRAAEGEAIGPQTAFEVWRGLIEIDEQIERVRLLDQRPPSRPTRSRNRNFSGSAKYSVSRRNPEKDRADQG